MYLSMSKEEIAKQFEANLLKTNRGYNYYVDWSNVSGLEEYKIEIHALDVLIRTPENNFKKQFFDLIKKLPTVISVFPFLFALGKTERDSVVRNGELRINFKDCCAGQASARHP